MLFHLPIIILTSLHPIAIADAVPQFEIARECQLEGGTKEMEQRCVADEIQARNQLQAEWIQFSPSAKLQCNEEASIDGTPSYVEFLTCLEMERDVRIEREAKTSQYRSPLATMDRKLSAITVRDSDGALGVMASAVSTNETKSSGRSASKRRSAWHRTFKVGSMPGKTMI